MYGLMCLSSLSSYLQLLILELLAVESVSTDSFNSFTPFPKLPTELLLDIWNYALRSIHTRVITFKWWWRRTNEIPTMLHTCHRACREKETRLCIKGEEEKSLRITSRLNLGNSKGFKQRQKKGNKSNIKEAKSKKLIGAFYYWGTNYRGNWLSNRDLRAPYCVG